MHTLNLVEPQAEHDNPLPLDTTSGIYIGKDFAERLNRTLEIEKLLQIFFNYAEPHIDCDGFKYTHKQLGYKFSRGRLQGHRLEYKLVLDGQELGQLVVFRSDPFSLVEVEQVDEQLCSLIYPLRNAALYQLALKSAYRDTLTGIDNRAAMKNLLPREISLAQRNITPTALLVADIDNFKLINDSFGHNAGDKLLCGFVESIKEVLRVSDLLFRYGGDEFVILLNNTDKAGAIFVAERIRERVEACKIRMGEQILEITSSVGLTQMNNSDTAESFFHRADEALLVAKRRGRNVVVEA